jgi:hypothetical protein
MPFSIEAVIRFLDLSPVSKLDAVNAAIIFGWTTPGGIRRYYNLLLNEEAMLVEIIGSRGGDAYLDYHHLNEGIPFSLTEGTTYAVSVRVAERQITAKVRSSNYEWLYAAALPEDPLGRVGLRPWRSRLECEKFVVRSK